MLYDRRKFKKKPNKDFSKRLKQLRKNKNVTQNELSIKAGIDYRHYQDVEAGRVNISFDTIDTIATALNVKPCYLLNFESNSFLNKMNILCPTELLSILNCVVQICDTGGSILYSNSMSCKKICASEGSEPTAVIKVWDLFYENSEKLRLQKYFETLIKDKSENGNFHTSDIGSDNRAHPISIYLNSLRDKENNMIGFTFLKVPRA